MTTNTAERLDADELLHLAMRASEANRHEESISYLKRALDVSPKNGKIHYMLGAEHAQIGLYDRAAEEMAKAVELDPTLHTASFQLGLLHITSGRVGPAEAAWKPLDTLGAEHPLYLFKTGLLHLARDEFEQCAEHLNRGISLNRQNEPLNNDMRRVLADVDKHLGKPADSGAAPTATEKSTPSNHVLLSAYRKNRSDDKE